MGLYKRGKVLWMAFTYQGRQIRRSTETTDKHLAKRIYDKILGEIAEGKWFERLPGEDKTVAELLDRYLNEYATFHQSSGTAVGTRIITEELEQVFGTMLLKELTPQRIVSYKVTCREKGLAPATINHRLGILRHAFKLAIREWGWIKENPAAMVVREKVNNDRDRWLTEDEEERLLEACLQYHPDQFSGSQSSWLWEIVLFALNTGMRQDEILSLEWPNIDLSRKTAAVIRSKNGEKRTIPLNQTVCGQLKEKARVRNIRCSYVYHSAAGTKIIRRNLMRAFYIVTERAKIEDFRFHDLRHTFATRLAQAGVDIYKIAKLLGHKDIRMTQRYAHHYPESLRDGVEVLDRKKIITNLSHSKKKELANVR
jgi:integrase